MLVHPNALGESHDLTEETPGGICLAVVLENVLQDQIGLHGVKRGLKKEIGQPGQLERSPSCQTSVHARRLYLYGLTKLA